MKEKFSCRKKMSSVRTLVVNDAHVLKAGEGEHELGKFRRINKLYGIDCPR